MCRDNHPMPASQPASPWMKNICEIIITRVSEVIMFSPCVFVCLCLYHDVCPDDLTMKDWCHTKNILQVHCSGCLVVQVMFHTLITSLMTSQDHKVGQILKLIYLRQYFSLRRRWRTLSFIYMYVCSKSWEYTSRVNKKCRSYGYWIAYKVHKRTGNTSAEFDSRDII